MTAGNLNMNQVCRVSIEGYMDYGLIQQEYVNVMHWEYLPAEFYGIPEMNDLSTIYMDDLIPFLRNCYYSDTTVLTQLRLRQVTGEGMLEVITPIGLSGTRTRDGDRLPPYSALVISLKTAYIGRRYRGRNYLGGFAEQDQQNGLWEADTANLVQDYIDGFATHHAGPFFEGDWSLGILSDPERTLPAGEASVSSNRPVINAVLTMESKPVVYVQRKRKFRNLLDIS